MNKTTQQASVTYSTTAATVQLRMCTTYHYKRLVKSIIMELFSMDSMKRLAAVIRRFPQGGSDRMSAVSRIDVDGVDSLVVKLGNTSAIIHL